MLSGLERCNRLPGVVGNGRIDVDGVDVWIFEQSIEVREPLFHPERIANGVQLLFCALANGVHVRLGMPLVNGNEFGPKSEAYNGHVDLSNIHHLLIKRANVWFEGML